MTREELNQQKQNEIIQEEKREKRKKIIILGFKIVIMIVTGFLLFYTYTTYVSNTMMIVKEDRIKNVKNVYSVRNQEKIINRNILLIDDIYTTGNTVNECSRVLKQAGAKNIGILTLAKD